MQIFIDPLFVLLVGADLSSPSLKSWIYPHNVTTRTGLAAVRQASNAHFINLVAVIFCTAMDVENEPAGKRLPEPQRLPGAARYNRMCIFVCFGD